MKRHQEIGVVSLGIGLGVALEVAVLLLATLVHHTRKVDASTYSETAHVQADGERNAAEWVRSAPSSRLAIAIAIASSRRFRCASRVRRRARRSAASSS